MYEIKPMGDKCITVVFKQEISEEVNGLVRRFYRHLTGLNKNGVVEAIPAYAAVSVIYNPIKIGYDEIAGLCHSIIEKSWESGETQSRIFEIPVLYGGEYGPDLEFVAKVNGITEDKVIEIHSGQEYLIYMLGFAPGFCYLGGLSEKIAAPRKDVPRQRITPGSVGIAGKQTGMYPIESPGGWQLIGRTPLKLYDPLRVPPVYYDSGDYIKYVPVDKVKYEEIKDLESAGKYKWVCGDYKKS